MRSNALGLSLAWLHACAGLVVVRNESGAILADLAGSAWHMSFGLPLNGNYSVTLTAPANLCRETTVPAQVPGTVVLGGGFYEAECSYETRARVAQRMNAIGIVYSGQLHTPFDWDGTSWDGITLFTAVVGEYADGYAAVAAAVREHGGARLEIVTEPTPLDDVPFAIFQWAFFSLLLLPSVVCIVAGTRQLYVLYRAHEQSTARLVISLETVSQALFFVRNLNGPGYDITHQMLIPHFVYRFLFSVFFDIHMLVMLIVSNQLRSTIQQIHRRMQTTRSSHRYSDRSERKTDGGSEFSVAQITVEKARTIHAVCSDARHPTIIAFVTVLIVCDIVFAIMEGLFLRAPEPIVIVIVQCLFFLAMGIYYLRQALTIDRALSQASQFQARASSRVRHFSKSVRRVGITLICCFLAFVCFLVLYQILAEEGVTFYVLTTVASFLFFVGQVSGSRSRSRSRSRSLLPPSSSP